MDAVLERPESRAKLTSQLGSIVSSLCTVLPTTTTTEFNIRPKSIVTFTSPKHDTFNTFKMAAGASLKRIKVSNRRHWRNSEPPSGQISTT